MLVVERHFWPDSLRPPSPSPRTSHSGAGPWANTVWGATITALLASLVLSDGNLPELALSAVPATAGLLAYISFTPRPVDGGRFLPFVDFTEATLQFSMRMTAILAPALCLELVLFGSPGDLMQALLSGLARALSWYFIAQTVRCRPPAEGILETW